MARPRLPDMFILDSLVNDVEDLEGILRLLNSDTELGWRREWGQDFRRDEVVAGLSRLIRDDAVRVFLIDPVVEELEEAAPASLPPGDYGAVYFGITPRGRLLHANWEPDTSPDTSGK